MNGTILSLWETSVQRNTIYFSLTFPIAIDPKTPFDTNAPVPTQLRKMFHQMRVCEATIRSKDDGTPERKQLSHLIQHSFIHVIGRATARMFQNCPHERDCPATIHERDAHQTVGIPQHRRIQSQIQHMVFPLGEGLSHEGPIEGMRVYPCIFEPAGKPTHATLRIHGSAVHI